MSTLPRALSSLSNRFTGISSSVIRVESSTARNGCRPNSTISFSLPASAIARLSTFQVHATVTCEATGDSIALIPDDIMGLIQRCEISCNGTLISGGSTYYNVINAAKRSLTGKRADCIVQHGELITSATDSYGITSSDTTSGDGTVTSPPTRAPYQCGQSVDPAKQGEKADVSFGGWEYGMLACDQEYVDLELLGTLTVKLTLASAPVLVNALKDANGLIDPGNVGTGACSYTLDGIFATMEIITVNNMAYDSVLSQQIQTAGYVPITFKEAQCTRSSHNSLTRVNVSSRSLDRILVGFRDADLDVGGVSHQDVGSKIDSYQPYGFKTAAINVFGSDAYGVYDPKIHFDLGGTRFPQFSSAANKEWVMLKKQALYDDEKKDTRYQFNESGLSCYKVSNILAAKLNLAGSSSAELATGIDSRGAALTLSVNSTGVNQGAVCYFITECSSLLMAGQGRQLQVLR